MFIVRYVLAELRRRRGRTILTSLGLAIGVALVAVVTALSSGISQAQEEVLEPLTEVGTDMTVSRPLVVDDGGEADGPGGFGDLSAEEQQRLQQENDFASLDFASLGEPGDPFSTDQFASTELTFDASEAATVAAVDGVAEVAPSLSLNLLRISGEVPEATQGVRGPGLAGGVEVDTLSVSGVDRGAPELGRVAPDQIVDGGYFTSGEAGLTEIIVDQAYAGREALNVGDTLTIAETDYTVVGIASTPLGGQSSDLYMPLSQLQEISDRDGRANVLQVQATDGGVVDEVAADIEAAFPDSSVTTASDLAADVGGSLVDAENLSNTLGTALAVVGMGAAVGLAALLTLGAVTRRTRELGTLKALGWPDRLIVREVAGESLAHGVIGGVAGVVLGVAAAGVVTAIGPELSATVVETGGGGFGVTGSGEVSAGDTNVVLSAPIELPLVLLALGLAIAAGLITGAIGGLRAARLRPADALRNIE